MDVLSKMLSPATSLIVDFLFTESPSQPLILSGTCLAIGEMGRCGPLLDKNPQRAVEKLVAIVLDAKVNGKIRERAALACGYLSCGILEYPKRKFIIETFLASAQVKHNLVANNICILDDCFSF